MLGLDVTEAHSLLGFHLTGEKNILMYSKENYTLATFTILNFLVDNIEQIVDELIRRSVHFEFYNEGCLTTDERGIFRGGSSKITWFKNPVGNLLSVLEG